MTLLEDSGWSALPRPAEARIFAVGDIHGRLDLLEAVLELVADRAAAVPGGVAAEPKLVMLGDIVDRGPRSLACLDRLAGGVPGLDLVCLAGNHEQLMILSLDGDPDARETWLVNGGPKVVAEMAELTGTRPPVGGAEWLSWARAAVGPDRLAFLDGLEPWYRSGSVVFVHAGLNPRLALEESLAQTVRPGRRLDRFDEPRSIFWVRRPFLDHVGPYPGGSFVVHGHTPHRDLEISDHRVCLDLGSVLTDRVGVAEIDGDRIRLYAVGP